MHENDNGKGMCMRVCMCDIVNKCIKCEGNRTVWNVIEMWVMNVCYECMNGEWCLRV